MGFNNENVAGTGGGGGGAGDASAANQVTGNASLSSIDGKLTNAATTTKQDTGNTSLASIDTKLTNNATTTLQTAGNSSLSTIATNTTNAATTTKQDTGNTSLSSIDTKLTNAATTTLQTTGNGSLATIATNTTNAATTTLQTSGNASLTTIATNTGAATPAGTNTMGAVFDLSNTFAASAMTRPADTTAYASGDLIANNTTAGSVTPISITIARANNAAVTIFRAFLRKSTTSTTNAQFRVHLFNVSPTVTNGDNGALLCTGSSNYLGFFDIDMTLAAIFSDGANGRGQPDTGSAVISKPVSGASTVFALLEARGAYTPGNAETFTLTLEATQS